MYKLLKTYIEILEMLDNASVPIKPYALQNDELDNIIHEMHAKKRFLQGICCEHLRDAMEKLNKFYKNYGQEIIDAFPTADNLVIEAEIKKEEKQ